MGKVIRFPTELRKCPVGKLAFHPHYGICSVVGAHGFSREIEYGRSVITVDVHQLRPIDPRKDLLW